MARQIKLSFKDKDYIIEYNRMSVKQVLKIKTGDDIDQVIALIKAGLTMHHKDELPSDDEIFGWVLALGEDTTEYAKALQEMVQDVLDTFKDDRKNLKWAKVEA